MGGDFNDEETFKHVDKRLREADYINKHKQDCIINIYPLPDKLHKSDPRKEYMDKHKKGQLVTYAFPLGFEAKFETTKP